ncbi:MAG: glycosyltransferase family A protein [Bacteroidales bacterium]|nr:glycosyltransferase family A protein [Bacteroidales bacterium]
MNERNEIAVIIPTYRPSEYLYDCLKSIRNQTVSTNYFEIIIVLNGDKFPYFNSISKWINDMNMNNCRVLYNEKKGVSAARNFGLENSKSDFVLFVDDDDLISPNYIEGLLINNNEKNSLNVSNFLSFTDKIHNNIPDYLTKAFATYSSRNKLRQSQYRSFFSSSCAKLISRKSINNSKFRTELYKYEDALFMFEISCCISEVSFTSQDVIYYRRVRPESVSRIKEPLWISLKNILIYEYWLHVIFLKKPTKYNLVLFITRIIAPIKTLFRI